MAEHVVFLLDNDKDFLNLYSKLLQSKGCQVFATDNLFLLLKYAKTALPEWIFIDENFAPEHEKELVNQFEKRVVTIDGGIVISDKMGGYYSERMNMYYDNGQIQH